jgi:hypothetical protein
MISSMWFAKIPASHRLPFGRFSHWIKGPLPAVRHSGGKGVSYQKANPADGRSQLLYATEKADQLKNSKASVEALYYEYLQETLSPEENAEFCRLLNILYTRSKAESKADFPNLIHRFLEGSGGK